ncbi:Chromatin assembly factor 1 subunit A, partial [Ophiophagus hannah]
MKHSESAPIRGLSQNHESSQLHLAHKAEQVTRAALRNSKIATSSKELEKAGCGRIRLSSHLRAACSTVSPTCTFPPKPFQRPAPKPRFFMPSRTRSGCTTSTKVYSLVHQRGNPRKSCRKLRQVAREGKKKGRAEVTYAMLCKQDRYMAKALGGKEGRKAGKKDGRNEMRGKEMKWEEGKEGDEREGRRKESRKEERTE